MQLELSDNISTGLRNMPFSNIRWTAIIAGLVVGISTHLLLMLLGTSAGLAAVDVTEAGGGGNTITTAVGIWNIISMLIAAFVGGYVAARTAGLRRRADGILHGVVAWGITMLVMTFLATTVAGNLLGTFFGSSAARSTATTSGPAAAQAARSIQQGDREEAIRSLETRLGLSTDQAAKMVDQALIMSGNAEAASPAGRQAAQDTLKTASIASGWLTAAILLSLLAAMGGGWLGALGTHREVRPDLHEHEHHAATTTETTAPLAH
ncbi:MAG: hypothetical protein H6R10_1538 [Rhodocyclaceae bacterium]|nr:hypothetical protein [Rhodocyclaceae bacterium]